MQKVRKEGINKERKERQNPSPERTEPQGLKVTANRFSRSCLIVADHLHYQPKKSVPLLEASRHLGTQTQKQATQPTPSAGPLLRQPAGSRRLPTPSGRDPKPIPDAMPFRANPIPVHLNQHSDFLKFHFQEQQCRTGQRKTPRTFLTEGCLVLCLPPPPPEKEK